MLLTVTYEAREAFGSGAVWLNEEVEEEEEEDGEEEEEKAEEGVNVKHTCCRGDLHHCGSWISCFASPWSESARSESVTGNLGDATAHAHTHLLRMYRRVCVSFCGSLAKPGEQ